MRIATKGWATGKDSGGTFYHRKLVPRFSFCVVRARHVIASFALELTPGLLMPDNLRMEIIDKAEERSWSLRGQAVVGLRPSPLPSGE